jgi:cysteine sulfinate desulfinase/cysteine desulfurase-like protein
MKKFIWTTEQKAVSRGREKVAGLIGDIPNDIIFTSRGTEHAGLAILTVRPNILYALLKNH